MNMNRRTLLASAAGAAAALHGMTTSRLAQAAAPMVGKQVPGFYRYKVGSYEVTVVTDGARPTPLSDGTIRNASSEAVGAAVSSVYPGQTRETLRLTFTPLVVNTGAKLVVIDTGVGAGALPQSKGAMGQFHSNFEASGYKADAVDTVIISHFHGDHIGGLLTADGKSAFPNAEILVPEPEWAHWMDDAKMNAAPDGERGGFQNARRVFGPIAKQISRYAPGKELVSGIESVASPGHTPGHTSHIVASGNDRILVQADITAGPALLFVRNPEWHFSFDTDPEMASQTRRKLYDMASSDKLMIQGFHFPFPSGGYVEKHGDGYEFVPAAWNPTI